jgi:hypothetical protein
LGRYLIFDGIGLGKANGPFRLNSPRTIGAMPTKNGKANGPS